MATDQVSFYCKILSLNNKRGKFIILTDDIDRIFFKFQTSIDFTNDTKYQ